MTCWLSVIRQLQTHCGLITRRAFRRLINNVYVKNIPLDMSEKKVKKMFAAYGNIKSVALMKNNIG